MAANMLTSFFASRVHDWMILGAIAGTYVGFNQIIFNDNPEGINKITKIGLWSAAGYFWPVTLPTAIGYDLYKNRRSCTWLYPKREN
jgi:hypothetical protein